MCVCEFLVIVPVCANDYVLDCSAIPCNRKRAGCAASLTKSCNWVERAHKVDYIWGSWTYLYSFSNWHTIGYLLVMQFHSHLSSVLFQFVLLLLRFFWQIAQLLSGRLPAACYHIRIRAQPQPDPSPLPLPLPLPYPFCCSSTDFRCCIALETCLLSLLMWLHLFFCKQPRASLVPRPQH